MKPIFAEDQLNYSSLKLRTTRKSSQRNTLWILQVRGFPAHPFWVSALRRENQPNQEAARAKLNYGSQERSFVDPTSQESGEKAQWNWRYNHFSRTGYKEPIMERLWNQFGQQSPNRDYSTKATSTRSKTSEDTSQDPEEPYMIWPYTSKHGNKKIFISGNLPFSDSFLLGGV